MARSTMARTTSGRALNASVAFGSDTVTTRADGAGVSCSGTSPAELDMSSKQTAAQNNTAKVLEIRKGELRGIMGSAREPPRGPINLRPANQRSNNRSEER